DALPIGFEIGAFVAESFLKPAVTV
ncbi:MAG: hypothetical protein RLZZ148_702, partial [Cyanobacteriota bacterium]